MIDFGVQIFKISHESTLYGIKIDWIWSRKTGRARFSILLILDLVEHLERANSRLPVLRNIITFSKYLNTEITRRRWSLVRKARKAVSKDHTFMRSIGEKFSGFITRDANQREISKVKNEVYTPRQKVWPINLIIVISSFSIFVMWYGDFVPYLLFKHISRTWDNVSKKLFHKHYKEKRFQPG